jgi:DNA-binding SARP family transcriptional activator
MDQAKGSPATLGITLFGSLQIAFDDKPIRGIAADKIRGLLIFLAVEADQPHRRNVLAEMFWPNRQNGVARKNLKQAIANLRKVLGDRETTTPFLLISRDEIQFNLESSHRVDVNEFCELLDASANHGHQEGDGCEDCEELLKQASELYQGEFLAEFSLPDSQVFEEWALINRELFQQRAARAYRELIAFFEEENELKEARKYARRLVRLAPWNEESHRIMMRLLARSGKRSAALKQYDICRRITADEFGVEPSKATKELYQSIREGEIGIIPTTSSPILSGVDGDVKPSKESGETKASRQTQLPLRSLLIPFVVLVIVISTAFLLWFNVPGLTKTLFSDGSQSSAVSDAVQPTDVARPNSGVGMFDSEDERAVLEAFYLNTGGDNWVDAGGWLSDQSVCSWYGVTCVAGSVSKLELADNHLNGPFPENLSDLSNLITLDFHGNSLSGEIPAVLGDLQNLMRLDLSFNKLNGSIPPELGKLENLVYLVLNGNHMLSGPIPPELGNLSSLIGLMLSSYEGGTQLSGTIPVELSNLQKLTHLEVSNSLVTGPIPPELGNLTTLIYLDLTHSPLSGALPPELGNLTNLQIFHIGEGRNSLYGSLPLNMMNWKKMRSLQFNGTDICEPSDPAFQAWLEGIQELYRTHILCPAN